MARSAPAVTSRAAFRIGLAILCALCLTQATNPYAAWVTRGRPLRLADNVLRVGVDASYPPFAVDGVDGPGGFEVDLAHQIAEQLGAQLALENTDVGGGLDALLGDRYDLMLAGLSASPDLTKHFAFSRPYFDDGPIALFGTSHCATAAAEPPRAVGTEIGSDGDLAARHQLGASGSNETVRRFGDRGELFAALQRGEIDAALLDGTSARLARRDHPELCLAQKPLQSRPLSIALQRRNAGLRFAVDDALARLSQSGALAALEQKWID
jgi:polar amino acid transport system substrate-binding protein